MKVAIIGSGAMGSLFASSLHAQAETWAFDLWQDHVAAIRRDGLRVRRGGGEACVPLRASADAAEIGHCDVALLFVKYGQTRATLEAASPIITSRTTVVTLQNGIGNVELIHDVCPQARVAFGLTTLTSELRGPGLIEASFRGRGETYFWPEDGNPSQFDHAFCDALNSGGINTELDPEIELRIWKKLVINCCHNTICAIAQRDVGELAALPPSWDLFDGIVAEIVAIARAKGLALDLDEARAYLRKVAGDARDHQPSMMIDIRSGRRTEIDCLNGAVCREGGKFGIPTPYNAAIRQIIKILEEPLPPKRGSAAQARC